MHPLTRPCIVALVLLAACGGEEPGSKGPAGPAQLYRDAQCVQCHGLEGNGTSLGPPLRDLGQHWTRERLAEYLADPRAAVAKEPRLQALDQRYMMPMQAYPHLSAQTRLLIADHVLGF